MTSYENWTKLRDFITNFPKNIESKRDLFKTKDIRLIAEYESWKSYFKIDRRLKPLNVIRELKRYKRDCLKFKAEELHLSKHEVNTYFDDKDKYTSSYKLSARVTRAMLGSGTILKSMKVEYKNIDLRYKQKGYRKIFRFKSERDGLAFVENLPDNIYINVAHADGNGRKYRSAYNKGAFDFVYDYHNQSNDFAENLLPYIFQDDIYLYTF